MHNRLFRFETTAGFWHRRDLTLHEKGVIMVIFANTYDYGCDTTKAQFAEWTGLSERFLYDILRSLESKKHIVITKFRDGNGRKRMLYKLQQSAYSEKPPADCA